MAYGSIEDLRERLGDDYEGLYATGGSQAAQNDLDASAAEIDGAASARYATPIASPSVEALLRDWNLTLCEERARGRSAGGSLGEKLKRRADQVRKSLDALRQGTFRLNGARENAQAAALGLAVCEEPRFERRSLRGF